MGLSGPLIQAVSDIVEKMYRLFVQFDLDMVEINPLGVSSTGEVMALDGKVTANDDALGRHSDLELLGRTKGQLAQGVPSEGNLKLKQVEAKGNIGILCNGGGIIRTTMDLLYKAGLKPAAFVNVAGKAQGGWMPGDMCERIELGLDLLGQDRRVELLLVNIISSLTPAEQIAAAIGGYWQRRTRMGNSGSDLHAIVRLVGSELDKAREILKELPVTVVESLDEAISQAINLTK